MNEVAKTTSIEVDGISLEVSDGLSIKEALEASGFKTTMFPSNKGLFMPCQRGGCWACALDIDGELRPACASKAYQGMKIRTETSGLIPNRVVGWFMGHQVGGVGTPWWLRGEWIEVVCFTAGCNFCCPQCRNRQFAYFSPGDPLTPEKATKRMTITRRQFMVDRIAISGGERTLNRRRLIQYISFPKALNPNARLHVDTNGSILTNDYLDDLADTGMTDIGIDIKASRNSTFQKITGLVDEAISRRYMETDWKAVEYLHKNHPKIFIGIGIPYNRDLIVLREMGRMIAEIDLRLQVSALNY